MSGFLSWLQQHRIRIQEQKPQFITDRTSFRLIKRIDNYSGKYDGLVHSFEVHAVEDCFLELSYDEKEWSSSKPEVVNAGNYRYFVRAKRSGRIEQAEATVEITRRKVRLVSASYNKEYDGLSAKAYLAL